MSLFDALIANAAGYTITVSNPWFQDCHIVVRFEPHHDTSFLNTTLGPFELVATLRQHDIACDLTYIAQFQSSGLQGLTVTHHQLLDRAINAQTHQGENQVQYLKNILVTTARFLCQLIAEAYSDPVSRIAKWSSMLNHGFLYNVANELRFLPSVLVEIEPDRGLTTSQPHSVLQLLCQCETFKNKIILPAQATFQEQSAFIDFDRLPSHCWAVLVLMDKMDLPRCERNHRFRIERIQLACAMLADLAGGPVLNRIASLR